MTVELVPAQQPDAASEARIAYARRIAPGAHIHLCGICGTGMAAILSLLKQLGYRVSGSDKAFYPPMGDLVRAEADKVYEGYAAENLDPKPALVVIGNALSRGNPEVERVLEEEIPFCSMPELFSALLIGDREHCRTSVVVAGTHGKTTTSAAVATLLDVAGRKPGYFIGGIPVNLPTNVRPVSSEIPPGQRVVVLEGDEYDSAFFAKYSKFHSYRPDIAIITSLEFDHADIYNSIEEIAEQFTRFVARVPEDGLILVCDQGEYLQDLAERWAQDPAIKAPVRKYGERADSKFRLLKRSPWRFQDIPEKRFGQQLELQFGDHKIAGFTPLTGYHNALNLLVAAVVARKLGVGDEELLNGLRQFSGVLRRQQIIFEDCGITLIEDFAHHPTAVKLTLEGLRESYPNKRVIAVFEPRSNTSRRAFFQEEYGACFAAAHTAVLLQVKDAGGYSNTSHEIVALNVPQLLTDIERRGTRALSFPEIRDIETFLVQEVRSGDLVVLMSNGDFGGLPGTLRAAFADKCK